MTRAICRNVLIDLLEGKGPLVLNGQRSVDYTILPAGN